jgi:putative ABC transport system permease protein
VRLEYWFYTIALRLRSLFRRNRMEQELDEELQIHLDQTIRQGLAMGKTPDDARHAALRAMGGMEQRKVECRDTRRVRWIEDLAQDAKYAVRALTKTPGFTVMAALVLALGIGANTAVFTIVNGVLLRALPFPEPDRLFLISYKPKSLLFDPGPSMVDRSYLEFRQHNHSFESLATFGAKRVTLTGSGDPVVLTASTVGPDFMRVLRVYPAIGRAFRPDGQADTNVVLLGDQIWHNRFNGDTQITGKAITLDGVSYSVAGVMPANFTFENADLWIRTETRLDPHNSFFLPVVGRLKPGVSPQQAQTELQAFDARQPFADGDNWTGLDAGILPLKELFVAGARKLLLIFAGAVAVVFLISCANFANLLLIRGASRQQEIAVRAALGASRWRLVRQLMTESTLLSLVGATLGVLFSVAGVRMLLALLPPEKIPRTGEVHLDGWVLVFTLGLSLVTGLVFGLAPALHITRRELRDGVSKGGRSLTGRHERFRGALVTAEIALALVLLTGAGLLVKSFVRMRSVNPGFRSANILAATIDLPKSRYQTATQMRLLDERVLSSLSLLPGAESVAAVSYLPFGWGVRGSFQLEDGRRLPDSYRVDKPAVSADYFRTMGIRLLSGREFNERDNSKAPGVVILSESVARRLWPGGHPIGKRISMEDHPKAGDWLTIVGIVSDVRQQSLTDKRGAAIYEPYRQANQPGFLRHMSFVIQTRENAIAMASAIRSVIHRMDQDLPTQSITTREAIVADSMTESRSQTRLLGIFSIMALLLAAVGTYGVLASSVAERTHEIGIRMAVGAGQKDILWMVFRRTLMLTGGGVVIGSVGALAVTRVLAKFLFEVTPTDPVTFVMVTAILIFVALFAAWIPAQRAARVHPLVALRYE